jgi:hypothetical protein
MSRKSGSNGEYVIKGGGIPPPLIPNATKLAITVSVKRMDIHR